MINHGKRGLHLVAVLSRKELVENLTKNHQNILKQNSDPKLVGGFQYICKPGMTPTRSHLNTTILRLEPFPFPTWHAKKPTLLYPRKEELLSALPEQKAGKHATTGVKCAKTDVEIPMSSGSEHDLQL